MDLAFVWCFERENSKKLFENSKMPLLLLYFHQLAVLIYNHVFQVIVIEHSSFKYNNSNGLVGESNKFPH